MPSEIAAALYDHRPANTQALCSLLFAPGPWVDNTNMVGYVEELAATIRQAAPFPGRETLLADCAEVIAALRLIQGSLDSLTNIGAGSLGDLAYAFTVDSDRVQKTLDQLARRENP